MKIIVLPLSIALGGALSASTCSAQFKPQGAPQAKPAACPAHTPGRSSTTRKQIADALRGKAGATTGTLVFNFDWLKVNGSWAYAETTPKTAPGSSGYEPTFAMLRRKNGLWSVTVRAQAAPNIPRTQTRQRLRTMFPSAPRDIFPR